MGYMEDIRRLVAYVTRTHRRCRMRIEGMSVKRIAAADGCSQSSVRRSLAKGMYYYQPDKPQPADLLQNPPIHAGREYEPACGTGTFLTHAADAAGKEAT